jgi:lysophospholipase L1-like esterase
MSNYGDIVDTPTEQFNIFGSEKLNNTIRFLLDEMKKRNDSTKKYDVATSTSHWWSDSVDQLQATIEGVERRIQTTPLKAQKVIVGYGSSSMEGYGTDNIETDGFLSLLANKLDPNLYKVYNRGDSAEYTEVAIERFHKDVAPLNPDFVILGYTLGNEGFVSNADKIGVYQRFKKNLLQLCHMVQQIGAVPIVMNQAPTNYFTVEVYHYSQKLNAELEVMGIHAIDWAGVVDAMDGTAKPIPSVMTDNVHYNNQAHVEICNAIPPSLFEMVSIQDGRYLKRENGYLRAGTISSDTPLYYDVSDITTFTASVRFRKATPALCTLMSFTTDNRIIMKTDGSLTLYQNGIAHDLPVKNYGDNTWYSLTIAYSPLAQKLQIYINAELILDLGDIATFEISKWCIGGRTGTENPFSNGDLKDAVLYRSRLTRERIRLISYGTYHQTSLEIYSPLHDSELAGGLPIMNLAPTTAYLRINELENGFTTVSV